MPIRKKKSPPTLGETLDYIIEINSRRTPTQWIKLAIFVLVISFLIIALVLATS